jgi:histidinol-phosphate aminotransferase
MVSTDDLPLRDELRGQHPYGAPFVDVPIRLNTNENPFGPSDELVQSLVRRVAESAGSLNRYPDREATELRSALARYVTGATDCDVTAAQIWPANGSNEVLQQLLQAFGGYGRAAMGFEPTYSMHRIICRGTGTAYLESPRAENFSLPIESAVAAVKQDQPDVVFLCSPNNPTGTAVDPDFVSAVYAATGGLVVVDEAYAEFSRQQSAVTALPGRPRLVVVRTMSKAFALAGARVGYAIADSAIIEALQLVRLPYHLSSVTQSVALAALEHSRELLEHVNELKDQRDRIVEELSGLGYPCIESDANFVLFAVDDSSTVWQSLLDSGVLIRDVGISGYLRVTAGTPVETRAFLDAVRHLTKEGVQ